MKKIILVFIRINGCRTFYSNRLEKHKKMGFTVRPKGNELWFVASYHPAGNQTGQYMNNVQEPKKESS